MSRATRSWMMVVIVAGLPVSELTAEANPPAPLTMELLVVDQVGVAPKVLARAKLEATRIYQEAGVKLVWTDGSLPGADLRLSVKIIDGTLKEADDRALGLAPGTTTARGTLAYLFYSRIHDFAVTHGIDLGVILGHVIAHELGHLLLPYNSHSKTGVMAAAFGQQQGVRAARGQLSFSADQARLIRATVAGWRTGPQSKVQGPQPVARP